MTDSEKIAMVYKHIDERLAALTHIITSYIYRHDQHSADEQADCLLALGERRALMELSHKLMEVQP